MTLEFRPPNIDPNAVTRQDRSLANLNQTISGIGDFALQYKKQKEEDARQKQIMAIQQAQEDRARQSFGPIDPSAWGGRSDNSSPQGASPSSNGVYGTSGPYPPPGTGYSPETGQPMSMAPQPGATPQAQPQMPIDHTSHFMNWKSQGMPSTYDHPDYGGTPKQNPMQQGFDPQTYYRLNQPQREAYLSGTKEQREGDFRNSEINKNNAMAEMYRNGGPSSGSVQWKQNPYTGEYEAYPTKPGAGNRFPTPGARPQDGAPGMGSVGGPGGNDGLPGGLLFKDKEKILKEKPKATGALNDTLREYDNMINEATAIKNDPSLGSATGMTHFMSNVPGTGARRASARLETLKAKTLLNVLGSLKQLSANGSSGFGALSNVEGEQIRNSISSLDPKMSKKDLQDSIDRFVAEMAQRKKTLQDTFRATYGDMPKQSGGGANKIQVSNGKETLWIDPADATDAAKDGYQ